MTENKKDLRRRLKDRPGRGDDGALCGNILAHPWFREARRVMAYAAMAGEPDLEPVLEEVLRRGDRLALPRMEPDGSMTARWVRDLGDLVPGVFGIREPGASAPLADPAELGLVLTPGMAFDRRGGRLGRGKGCYDRFLPAVKGRTLGICYHSCLLEKVPMEDHDRYLGGVVTDREIIYTGTEETAP